MSRNMQNKVCKLEGQAVPFPITVHTGIIIFTLSIMALLRRWRKQFQLTCQLSSNIGYTPHMNLLNHALSGDAQPTSSQFTLHTPPHSSKIGRVHPAHASAPSDALRLRVNFGKSLNETAVRFPYSFCKHWLTAPRRLETWTAGSRPSGTKHCSVLCMYWTLGGEPHVSEPLQYRVTSPASSRHGHYLSACASSLFS